MNIPTLTHSNCQNTDCRVCMRDADYLLEYLIAMTGNQREDHLGMYHLFLSKRGIVPETEWGWFTDAVFYPENIRAYIADWVG